MKTVFLILASLFVANGFAPKQIEGKWKHEYHKDGVDIYSLITAEHDDKGWMKFEPKGQLTVRQNAGWCGTPPISYRNYSGEYDLTKKGKLTLINSFWGGLDTTHYQIVAVEKDTLRMRFVGRGEL